VVTPVNYLVDTSALARVWRTPEVAARITALGPNRLHICTPVLLEIGVSARNAAEHGHQINLFTAGMRRVHFTPAIEERAIEVQAGLAARGQHRSARLADLLIAATAEHHDLTVLHYDSDYDLIAAVTGQPAEWVVERGSVS
jgi:predicted nucleic acid-binding protein